VAAKLSQPPLARICQVRRKRMDGVGLSIHYYGCTWCGKGSGGKVCCVQSDVFAVTYKHRHGSTIQKEYKRKEEDGAQLDVEPRGRME
jgi:hypothetical protein